MVIGPLFAKGEVGVEELVQERGLLFGFAAFEHFIVEASQRAPLVLGIP